MSKFLSASLSIPDLLVSPIPAVKAAFLESSKVLSTLTSDLTTAKEERAWVKDKVSGVLTSLDIFSSLNFCHLSPLYTFHLLSFVIL